MDTENEADNLLSNFLKAVKSCQIRFGGHTELATEKDPCIGNLCQILEGILEHGLLTSVRNRGSKTIEHMKNLVSSRWNFQTAVGNIKTDRAVVWWFIRELLTQHEYRRFLLLENVVTDVGRSRAWIRSLLNEHSLERYINIILSEQEILNRWYEPWALLRNQEKSSMLPNVVAGLDNILFAININNETLNEDNTKFLPVRSEQVENIETYNCIAELSKLNSKEVPCRSHYKKRKKKLASQVISFDEDYLTKSNLESNLKNNSSSNLDEKNFYKAELFDASSTVRVVETADKLQEKTEVNEEQNKFSYNNVLDSVFVSSSSDSFLKLADDNPNKLDGGGMAGNLSKDIEPLKTISGSELNLIPLSPDGEVNNFYIPTDSVSINDYQADNKKLNSDENIFSMKSNPNVSNFTMEELKSAVLEISRSRDIAEEKHNETTYLLNKQVENTDIIKAALSRNQATNVASIDNLSVKVKSLTKENDLLRHQLKKYVSAVQMLRRDEADTTTAEEKVLSKYEPDLRDYHDEALAYESKLIQVAEMHGELIEFNEGLQNLLRMREFQVDQLREKLVELRGPFPEQSNDELFDDAISIRNDLDIVPACHTLINIWIPTAFLAGPPVDTHHVYQIYIRIKEDEWNVYRRFSQFYELHNSWKKKFPIVKTFDFPPKKTFRYKDMCVVEGRRTRLQEYLRKIINILLIEYPKIATEPSKTSLTEKIPFLIDPPSTTVVSSQGSRINRLPLLSSTRNDPAVPNSRHYNGL